jgi:hypothetical protein
VFPRPDVSGEGKGSGQSDLNVIRQLSRFSYSFLLHLFLSLNIATIAPYGP